MKLIDMPTVRQRWLTLDSRRFRVFYTDRWGKEQVLETIRKGHLIYLCGMEQDPDEYQHDPNE